MSHDRDTASMLTLSIIHRLKVAQELNNASNKKRGGAFNLVETMCVSICLSTWAAVALYVWPTLMYDRARILGSLRRGSQLRS